MTDYKQFDPRYVQISRKEACTILGVSMSRFDEMRTTDPACPTGFKTGKARSCPVLFRLSDIYAYSEHLMAEMSEFESQA